MNESHRSSWLLGLKAREKSKMKTTKRRTPSILFTAMTDFRIYVCKFMLKRRCTILIILTTTTIHQYSFLPGLVCLPFSFFLSIDRFVARYCFFLFPIPSWYLTSDNRDDGRRRGRVFFFFFQGLVFCFFFFFGLSRIITAFVQSVNE